MLKKKEKKRGGQYLKKKEKKGGIIGSCPHVPVLKIRRNRGKIYTSNTYMTAHSLSLYKHFQ